MTEQIEQILPTPLRLGADERLAGRGVTIAFLDSGFYPHPDLTRPENRVLHYVNTAHGHSSEDEFHSPDSASWHGTMTSVVATGNGYLSGGRYRGIASEANVVLVKVWGDQGIHNKDIIRGIEWVIEHRDEYGIRIVNISCGGDHQASYLTDELSRKVEDAVRAGVVVVCAAGNHGHCSDHPLYTPASTPAVITVGGVNDKNNLYLTDSEMYCSSYGPTVDGVQKPEVVAPSILLAAPILPETQTAAEAELLAKLKLAPDDQLNAILKAHAGVSSELDAASDYPPGELRQFIEVKISSENIIGHSYKHVDGTSFAAPIVSSIVAQMLEANPALTPQQIKRILMDTAERIPDVPIDQQGWGVVIPARAVAQALQLHDQ
ncbi:MAG: S8 family serine peptidase [Acidobacteriota bacterium]